MIQFRVWFSAHSTLQGQENRVLRSHHTIFHSGCTTLHSHSAQGLQLLHILKGNSPTLSAETANRCSHCGKQYGVCLKKRLKEELPCDPSAPLLDIYPEKKLTWKDACTPEFTAAYDLQLLRYGRNLCPPRDDWIKRMWYLHAHTHTYIYKMEYYSAIKRMKFCHLQNMNGLGKHYAKWSKSDKYYVTSLTCGI